MILYCVADRMNNNAHNSVAQIEYMFGKCIDRMHFQEYTKFK